MRLQILAVTLLLAWPAVTAAAPAPGAAERYERLVKPFLEQHCFGCHDARQARAGFRVDELGLDLLAGETADKWLEVMDRINLGEMPPEKEPRPDAEVSFAVVQWIAAQLNHAEKTARSTGGRTPMRRLNRDEYANTVRDLLKIDAKRLAPIVEELPGDGRAEGFDRLGVALFFDRTQLERSLAAADQIAELSIVEDKPVERANRSEAEANPRVRPPRKPPTSRFANTPVDPGPSGHEIVDDGVRFVHGYGNRSREDPWGRLGGTEGGEVVQQDGYYRIRIRAGADRGSRGTPIRVRARYATNTPVEADVEIPIDAPLDDPRVHEAVVFLRSGPEGLKRSINFTFNDVPDLIQTTPENNRWFRVLREAQSKLREATTSGAPAKEVEAARAELDALQAEVEKWKGPLRRYNPERDAENPPTIFVDWFEISGPIAKEWPPESHRLLLFDGDERNDLGYAREIVARFLPRAFRRPVEDHEVERVVAVVAAALDEGREFPDALRMGLARILVSPGFLFLREPVAEKADGPRPLDDHEIASRLSYFLWSSMPDDRLFDLAKAGRLSDPKVLHGEVDRMLADPRASEFVENFGGQWLGVREFGSVMPATEYRDYDLALEESSKREAIAFVGEVVSANLPITTFLDSDFVMVNERLARHYGIEGVEGDEIRRVPIGPDVHRGGILGMAGLLTLLADGTRTLPVRRAAWIKTNLFNDPPPPPPPNAGEVQPNTAGEKLTVRERLERHRNEPTCASCHAILDPYGLALENYDAIGAWRTRQNGEGFRGNNTPELDVSGTLPSGRAFESLEEFKAGLLAEKDEFATAFTERLLTYALCRPVGYTDRRTVEELTTTLDENEYRIRSLIHAIVVSEPFLTK